MLVFVCGIALKLIKYLRKSTLIYQSLFEQSMLIKNIVLVRYLLWVISSNTRFFINNAFFSTQPQCYLTFSRIELQMLFRCCLIDVTIIILRRLLYLLYFCPCLELGLFMSHYDLVFIFTSTFIMINCLIS